MAARISRAWPIKSRSLGIDHWVFHTCIYYDNWIYDTLKQDSCLRWRQGTFVENWDAYSMTLEACILECTAMYLAVTEPMIPGTSTATVPYLHCANNSWGYALHELGPFPEKMGRSPDIRRDNHSCSCGFRLQGFSPRVRYRAINRYTGGSWSYTFTFILDCVTYTLRFMTTFCQLVIFIIRHTASA